MHKLISTLTLAASLNGFLANADFKAPHELLPYDTIAVFTIPNFKEASERTGKSPSGLLWGDPALRPFKEQFMAQFRSQVLEPFEKETGLEISKLQELAQGQITVAVSLSGTPSPFNPPNLLAIIDSGNQREQLSSTLDKLKAKATEANDAIRTVSIRDVEFLKAPLEDGDGPSLFLGQAESAFLASTSEKVIERVLSRQAGQGSGSLLANPTFAADQKDLFSDSLIYGWLNLARLMEIAEKEIEKASRDQEANPMATSPKAIFDALGIKGLKSASFAGNAKERGDYFEFHLGIPASERKGLFSLLEMNSTDSAPPRFVPDSALTFSRSRFDIKGAYQKIETMVNSLSPFFGLMLQGSVSNVGKERDANFDLKNDFLFNLGDDLISWQMAPADSSFSALQSPPSANLLSSPNAEKLASSIIFLAGYAKGQAGIELTTREQLGRQIHTLQLPPTPNPLGGEPVNIKINFTAVKGHLLFATDDSIMEAYLRDDGRGRGLTAGKDGFGEAIQEVGGVQTGLFGYQNDRLFMRSIVDGLRLSANDINGMLKMIPAGENIDLAEAFKQWVDLEKLPEFNQIQRYFNYTVYAGNMDARGMSIKIYSPHAGDFNRD